MRNIIHETMYILRPDLADEQVDEAIDKYKTVLQEAGGDNVEIQHRGKRRLGYEINKHRDGIYIQMNYKSSGNAVAVVERSMRLSEDVIRYLTIKQEESDSPAPAEAPEDAVMARE
jgi:small subunit ribosomal protein S6